jgi:hypothetical protein
VTTQINTWIIGVSTAIAAVILMLTLAIVGRVDEARTQAVPPVQPTQTHGGSVLSGPQAQAADRAAQSDLRNAFVAARVLWIDQSTYASANASPQGLITLEPNLCYVGPDTVSVAAGAVCESGAGNASISVFASAHAWSAARLSESGTCFWLADDTTSVTYGTGTQCTGTIAAGASDLSW